MVEDVSVRRVAANEAAFFVDRLADILIDCVEDGASVSFMWPLPRARALKHSGAASPRMMLSVTNV